MFTEPVIAVLLGVLGLILGSFAGATVWRIRARQLKDEHKTSKPEHLHDLTKGAFGTKDRSKCLYCGHTLNWYDLVPLFSWAMLKGKCRYCRHKIGYFEPLAELSVAGFFVLSYLFWPYDLTTTWGIISLIIWLVADVTIAVSFFYDAKWLLLPDNVNYATLILGVLFMVGGAINSPDPWGVVANTFGAIAFLAGIYLIFWLVSRGNWIGFGDIRLGLSLALFMPDWRLGLLALFLANVLGLLVVLPGLLSKKLNRRSKIPFGPFLILGSFIAVLWGAPLVELISNFLFL